MCISSSPRATVRCLRDREHVRQADRLGRPQLPEHQHRQLHVGQRERRSVVAGEDLDLTKLLSLLRARKVFRQTKILYPTWESSCVLRLLMSVSNKSCHQGNGDVLPGGTFRINHSAPSMKMNGLDQPDLPYQLGRFTDEDSNRPDQAVLLSRVFRATA